MLNVQSWRKTPRLPTCRTHMLYKVETGGDVLGGLNSNSSLIPLLTVNGYLIMSAF
jgi:hypothetical protein